MYTLLANVFNMKTIYKHYKNSNTGEIMKSQEFTETEITGMPIFSYGSSYV